MDDVRIRIDELVLDGSAPLSATAVAAAIAGRAAAALDPDLLPDVARGIAASVRLVLPEPRS